MRNIDWNTAFEQLAIQLDCSDSVLKGKRSVKLLKRREELDKAFETVKKIAQENPNLSSKAFRRKVYATLFPGLWPIVVMTLLSTVIRMVVEYLIGQLYPEDKELNNGSISVPPERL